jgi:hypothetical protein
MTPQDLPPAIKLMIQSGMVPESMIRQLINWRLLPEDSEKLIGNQTVSLEETWETVEQFIDTLKSALVNEMKTIRETELDRPGGFRDAKLYFNNRVGNVSSEKVFVDRLDRVVTPAEDKYSVLTAVQLLGGPIRSVLKHESRFEGDQEVAFVHYLEPVQEESHAN